MFNVSLQALGDNNENVIIIMSIIGIIMNISIKQSSFGPEGILSWDADDDSHDEPKMVRYFQFHDELRLQQVLYIYIYIYIYTYI